jgi:TetR/AcrR family transcriptional regulator, repressor for neighboring sulfatase
MERMAAEDVRSLLVASLVELLKTRSAEAISVRDVAAAAGVNHGLVHRYFGSKQGLIDAAVEQLSAEVHRGRPDRAAMSAASFAYLRAHPELARIVARACLDGPPALLARAAPPPARLEAIVAPIRAALSRAGADHVDAHLLNALASAALLGWFVFQPLLAKGFGLPPDADDQLAQLLELLDRLVERA